MIINRNIDIFLSPYGHLRPSTMRGESWWLQVWPIWQWPCYCQECYKLPDCVATQNQHTTPHKSRNSKKIKERKNKVGYSNPRYWYGCVFVFIRLRLGHFFLGVLPFFRGGMELEMSFYQPLMIESQATTRDLFGRRSGSGKSSASKQSMQS